MTVANTYEVTNAVTVVRRAGSVMIRAAFLPVSARSPRPLGRAPLSAESVQAAGRGSRVQTGYPARPLVLGEVHRDPADQRPDSGKRHRRRCAVAHLAPRGTGRGPAAQSRLRLRHRRVADALAARSGPGPGPGTPRSCQAATLMSVHCPARPPTALSKRGKRSHRSPGPLHSPASFIGRPAKGRPEAASAETWRHPVWSRRDRAWSTRAEASHSFRLIIGAEHRRRS